MYTHYVYLKVSEQKLFITETEIDNSDYFLLLTNTSTDYQISVKSCKVFCSGVLWGAKTAREHDIKLTNDEKEFR